MGKVVLGYLSILSMFIGCDTFDQIDRPHHIIRLYSFEEKTGSIATDRSSSGKDATIIGAVRIPGKVGQAISFNGSGKVQYPPHYEDFKDGQISIEVWIHPYDLPDTNVQHLLGGGYDGYRLQIRNHRVEFLMLGSSWPFTTIIESDSAIRMNEWTHVTVTFDGTVSKLYLNGELNSERNFTFPIFAPYNVMYMGSESATGDDFNRYNGALDEVRIWNAVLSNSEIRDNFNVEF